VQAVLIVVEVAALAGQDRVAGVEQCGHQIMRADIGARVHHQHRGLLATDAVHDGSRVSAVLSDQPNDLLVDVLT
jgi:hypothetical protein